MSRARTKVAIQRAMCLDFAAMATVVTVMNMKGGVGKTSVCAHLAEGARPIHRLRRG